MIHVTASSQGKGLGLISTSRQGEVLLREPSYQQQHRCISLLCSQPLNPARSED